MNELYKAGEIRTAEVTEHSMDNQNLSQVCHWFDAWLLINHLRFSSFSPLIKQRLKYEQIMEELVSA